MRVLKVLGSKLVLPVIVLISTGKSGAADNSLYEQLEDLINIVVAADGSGDHLTVQAGINAVPNNSSSRTILFIRNGTYREKIYIPSGKVKLTMIGEHVDSTIIVYNDYAGRVPDMGTFESQTIEIQPGDFRAMNITFENDARPDGTGDGQNVAVSSYGDRNVFLHCRFISWQDTYYTGANGRHYFKDCFIEGAVDYIFGHTTTIFDSCQIHSVRSGSYKTAASTKENYAFGYVFFNCHLTAPPGVSNVWLGRPWKTYAQTVFFRCAEYECIHPLGWNPWKGDNIASCYYAEYICTGPGSDISDRADWSHQLSDGQAASYTMQNIFSKQSSPDFSSDWNPNVDADTVYTILKRNIVIFMDSVNLDASIASLKLNGEELPGWNPDSLEYFVELPAGTTEIPVIEASASNPLSSVEIEYPDAIPGFAGVTILARNQASHQSYSIYLSTDGASGNALLDSIKIAKIHVPGFAPETFEYEIILPEGTNKYAPVSAYKQAPDTKVSITKPQSFPGTYTIVVTAVDGSSNTYTVDASISTGISEKAISQMPVFIDPAGGRVCFRVDEPVSGPISFKLYSLKGFLLFEKKWDGISAGEYQIPFKDHINSGMYIYQLYGGDFLNSGKTVIRTGGI